MSEARGPGQPEDPLLVLKIGGSLVSDKRTEDDLSTAAVTRWAGLVADLATAAPGRCVLVAGGGAIGHGAVRDCPEGGLAALRLTEATFAVKTVWAQAMRAAGVHALPLQVAALAGIDGDEPRLHWPGVFEVLHRGVLPVLSGDVVLTVDGRWQVLSSDRVPELLLAHARQPVRVVMLTNVPGLLRDARDEHSVVPYVDPERLADVEAVLWPGEAWDTTDAMAGKLRALARMALRGAEGFVLRGDPGLADLRFLLDAVEDWPEHVRFTRVARDQLAKGGRCDL